LKTPIHEIQLLGNRSGPMILIYGKMQELFKKVGAKLSFSGEGRLVFSLDYRAHFR
jgi:hypothetical protein